MDLGFALYFFFQAEDGIRDYKVTGVQTCALPIWHIARKVVESCRELGKALDDKVALDIESHYQLANRAAWSVKVAAMGTPIVLLYLGFIGDKSIPRYLRSAEHWERVMGAYLHGKLPLS